MTRIAIAGAAGRMGRNLVLACSEADGIELTQALEREGSARRSAATAACSPVWPQTVSLIADSGSTRRPSTS